MIIGVGHDICDQRRIARLSAVLATDLPHGFIPQLSGQSWHHGKIASLI